MFKFSYCQKWVINLERRPDRLAEVSEQLFRFGVLVWRATDSKDVVVPELCRKNKEHNAAGIYACALSHISLIKEAKERNLEYVTIFEDDCVISKDFDAGIKEIEDYEYWDVAYLGGHDQEAKQITGNIYKVSRCSGTYGYILRNTTFDYILRNWIYEWGWDEFLAYHVQDKFRTIARLPFIVGTKANYSDVAFHDVDYKIADV